MKPMQMRPGDVVRQGDIALVRLPVSPTDKGKEIPREHGAVVLAYGESSGHRHQLAARGCKLFQRGSARMLEISARGGALLEVTSDRGAPITPARHSPVKLAPGSYEAIRQREYHEEDVVNAQD
jgi:hypothetical protein